MLRPGGVLVLSVPWPVATYDRLVPVSSMYDLVLAHSDDADGDELRPEVAAHLAARVAAYRRLADPDTCICCPDDLSDARGDKGYHWHVWDLALLREAMRCLGATVEFLGVLDNWHQMVIARVE